ncbi:tRNA (adenine-N(1)-)-methyltransferase catalytic subunit trm61 [Myotisia sp. PD_48]|nr:tRNA (adenine-N(1)-)-methyltransferase catalytic subunit trm61 [Myotisia sp. PD_48]
MPSPFLSPGQTAEANSLAILHLRRDQLVPTILKAHDDEGLGYSEGKVTNTRFGSFPHSTLIGRLWGSQITASNVDTGSRGRGAKSTSRKRKADEAITPGLTSEDRASPKAAVAASSGFIHLLPPTPEYWTASLPHRTQVVYTPDYSYILHRLRVRPGSTIIEAGSGSGSFTHASSRAVFSGYPSDAPDSSSSRRGRVCSFEFHAQRVERIRQEIVDHGLEEIVTVGHRDVCEEGFLLEDNESPKANAIFLDLPAPWLALPHLTRETTNGNASPLDPASPVHICTFSPCLEQVQQTVSTLRQYGWLFISMVEISHKNIEVWRERYGTDAAPTKALAAEPRSVDQAINRLRMYEARTQAFRQRQQKPELYRTSKEGQNGDMKDSASLDVDPPSSSIPPYRQGTLIHRSESELKTHTSYLTFATLPCAWSDEDEKRCREKWPSRVDTNAANYPAPPKSKKQLKREFKAQREREAAEDQRQKASAPEP